MRACLCSSARAGRSGKGGPDGMRVRVLWGRREFFKVSVVDPLITFFQSLQRARSFRVYHAG